MHSPPRILIVDDNEANRDILNARLEAHGYELFQAADGEEALAAAKEHLPDLILLDVMMPKLDGIEAIELARAHRPDLILMDIQLPEVSGLEVTKWLKEDEELKSIPVIAVTAFAMKGDEERIREGGFEAYLSKPISVAKFLATVRTYLGDA